MSTDDGWRHPLETLGSFIRSQRRLANLSLRELAERTEVSNPYLSQIERGLHEPSVRVLKAIALALDLSAETLLFHSGLLDGSVRGDVGEEGATVAAIRADAGLTESQKRALLAVYRSYARVAEASASESADSESADSESAWVPREAEAG
jgi:transcriptional regulator with XRE-family HTH domain